MPRTLLERIGATRVEPLSHGGNSGAALLRAGRADGTAFVLKRVSTAGADWLARATGDRGRTAQLYLAGAFDADAAGDRPRHRGGRAIRRRRLDRDARRPAELLAPDARLSREDSRRILAAAAQLHRAFHDRVPPGAACLSDRIGMSTHDRGRRGARRTPTCCRSSSSRAGTPSPSSSPSTSATRCSSSRCGPGRLADALLSAHGAPTLIHGDLRGDNLGFDGERVVLIDWDLATAGTPTVEFAWYLAHSARRIDATHDADRGRPPGSTGRRAGRRRGRARHALRPRSVRLAHRA